MALDPKTIDLKTLETHYIRHNIHRTKPRDYHRRHYDCMAARIDLCPGFSEICIYCEYYENLPIILPPVYKKIPCLNDVCIKRIQEEEKREEERKQRLEEKKKLGKTFSDFVADEDDEFGLFD